MSESITGKGKGWEFAKFWWLALLCFIMLGWISFVYMGVKTKTRKWIIEGIIYCVLLHVSFAFTPLAIVYTIFYIASIVRIFLFRKEYLTKRATVDSVVSSYNQRIKADLASNGIGMTNSVPTYSTNQTSKVADAIGISTNNTGVINNENMPDVIDTPVNSQPIVETGEEVTDVPVNRSFSDDVIVDINNCDADMLESLPGISVVMAKKAISHRDDVGGYDSLDDFYSYLELKPHIISQISERIKCGQKPEGKAKQGRRILDL